MKKLVIILLAVFCFCGQFIFPILNVEYPAIFRFLTVGLSYLIIPFFLQIKGYISTKGFVFWFVLPALFFLGVTITAIVTESFYVFFPIGVIGVISVLLTYIAFKKGKISIVFIGVVFIFISSYIYGNWLYGMQYKTHLTQIDNIIEMVDENDVPFNFETKKGKVLVIDVWSSACGICYSLYLPLKRDKGVDVRKYIEKYTFKKVYCKNIDSWKRLDITGVPQFFIIDKKGKIQFKGVLNMDKIFTRNNSEGIINKLIEE